MTLSDYDRVAHPSLVMCVLDSMNALDGSVSAVMITRSKLEFQVFHALFKDATCAHVRRLFNYV